MTQRVSSRRRADSASRRLRDGTERSWGPRRRLAVFLLLFIVPAYGSEAPEKKAAKPWHQTFPATPEATVSHYPSIRSIRTIKDIDGIIAEGSIDSVEGLLARLKELDSEMFRTSVQVFWTKALQEAEYQAPRVILRSRSGKLALTFNGDPRQEGYDAVEMMEYDAAEGRYVFDDRVFSKGKKPRPSGADCAACHAYPYADPLMNRPLFEPYPVWPRMYGGTKAGPKSELELKEYEKFRKAAKTHPRYKYLQLDDLVASCDPNESGALPRLPRRVTKGAGPVKNILKMHALFISWNLDRIVKRLARHPRYAELKPKMTEILDSQVVARTEGDDGEHQYSYQDSFNESPFFDYDGAEHGEADMMSGNEFDGDAWDNLLCSIYDNPPADLSAASPRSLEFTRFLSEEFGFDLDYQGMALSRNDKLFKAGIRFIPDIFIRALEFTEPVPVGEKEAKSLWPPAPKLSAERVLKANCASCHREGNSVSAKAIPFGEPEKFAAVLDSELAAKIKERLETGDPEKRMPRKLPPLSDEERELLLAYLRKIRGVD